MRRSTIYLGISLALLGVGLFNARRKGRRCTHTTASTAPCKPTLPPDQPVAAPQKPVNSPNYASGAKQLLDEAYEEGLRGKFASASQKARLAAVKLELAQAPWADRHEAELMLGYAERGNEMFSNSILTHNRIIAHAASETVEPWVLIDAHVGRAAAALELERLDEAQSDLVKAMALALEQAEGDDPDGRATYQLACVYAVRSQLREKQGNARAAEMDRHTAVARLRIATFNGYENLRHMAADLDLRALRGMRDFESLLQGD